jgi:hypothetical protein
LATGTVGPAFLVAFRPRTATFALLAAFWATGPTFRFGRILGDDGDSGGGDGRNREE